METIKRIREFISELPRIRIAHKNPLHVLKEKEMIAENSKGGGQENKAQLCNS